MHAHAGFRTPHRHAAALKGGALLRACLALLALMLLLAAPARAADIEILHAHIESSEEGYRLSSSYAFDLNANLEAAIQRQVPLYFTTSIEITRPRWYWRDEKVVSKSQTAKITYNVYTRQYRVTILDTPTGTGGVQHNFQTLDDALFALRRPSRWTFAPRSALKPGETYQVSVQMGLDLDFLGKPIQVYSFNNSDWRLTSRKKTFTYRPE